MNPQSPFYILRTQERKALELITRSGVTLMIKGSPQTGKSSLLCRLAEVAQTIGKRAIIIDFQKDFDASTLIDSQSFFKQFCSTLSDALDLEDKVEEYWKRPLSNARRCERYVERYILSTLNQPLLVAMDEVERIFNSKFRSDFFGMLRAWHSFRARKPIWVNLDLAVALYSDPVLLIDNLHQSPFNVGTEIELGDLLFEQLIELNFKHNEPFSASQLQKLMELLNGHPYLIRRALFLVASKATRADDLFQEVATDKGPFGNHLRLHLRRLDEDYSLRKGFLQVLRSQTCANKEILFRLEGQGLVCRVGKEILPRCQLYAKYFREHLDD